jgi:tetratricopeptide (TPR) repeat protein
MASPETARLVELAVAAAPAPLSVDTLVGWNLARPGELWGVLAAAHAAGTLAQPELGQFAFADAALRHEALARAEPAAWSTFLSSPERIAWTITAARAAAADRRFADAADILRALVAAKPREAFPGGPRGWLEVVLESVRLSRAMYFLDPGELAEAVALAAGYGDVAAQGVLEGALASAAMREGRVEDASAHLGHARDAARACSGRVRAEIQMYLAVGLTLQGRLREAIDGFEELLGDLPDDLESLIERTSASPATSVLALVGAYCAAGQVPRALDLLDRLRSIAVARDLPALESEADLFSAIAHETRDEHEAARGPAERAWAFYEGTRTDPLLLWFASTTLARVRAWERRFEEIPPILSRGVAARRAARWPWLGGTSVLELLEILELEGIAVPGLELADEIERSLGAPSVFWRGVAHR